MTDLATARCQPCQADAPRVGDRQMADLLRQLPDWSVEVRNGVMQLERVYAFRTFRHALAFTNAVADLAEQENHHPALLTEWGKVTVTWWSHSLGGLHRNDFIMAARTDVLGGSAEGRKAP